ncbi:hypothetical protein NKW84_14200 [Acetobacter senegalensis]|uniref:hypothetical protein n=1 Tax=Acetobacter senegalensis TaxID=446692 RepID=UPI00209F8CF6|nr:hypothetical protein [Acetobacter senegalensis]MCP1197003.1 hypothetical protein [Acetobacter senegalensis]
MNTVQQIDTQQKRADWPERPLIRAATLAGKAVATYRGLSQTTFGEITNALAFIALGTVLMCCTDAGWWMLGQWADNVTELVLYLEEVA